MLKMRWVGMRKKGRRQNDTGGLDAVLILVSTRSSGLSWVVRLADWQIGRLAVRPCRVGSSGRVDWLSCWSRVHPRVARSRKRSEDSNQMKEGQVRTQRKAQNERDRASILVLISNLWWICSRRGTDDFPLQAGRFDE